MNSPALPCKTTPPGARAFSPRFAFVLVFFAALFVRVAYFVQMRDSEIFWSVLGDSHRFMVWATSIVEGKSFAPGVFYTSPLYPYFLSVIFKIFGTSLFAAFWVQMLAGSLACVLAAGAGTLFFSRKAGLAAGLLLAVYPAGPYFDCLLQKDGLSLFLFCLLLFMLGLAQSAPAKSRMFLLGVAFSLFSLNRENAFFLFPVVLAWVFLKKPLAKTRRLATICCFMAGVLAVLLPVGLRNKAAGNEFSILTAHFGANLFLGNNERATGLYMPLRFGRGLWSCEREDAVGLAEQAVGHPLSETAASWFYVQKVLVFIHGNPRAWARLLWKKWRLFWGNTEIGDTQDIYTSARESFVLRAGLAVLGFGTLTALTALGCCLTAGSWRRLWILHGLGASYAASVVLFFIFDRYRYPLVAVLVLFAGAGICQAGECIAARRFKPLFLALACAVAVYFFCSATLVSPGMVSANTLTNMGIIAKGDDARAKRYFALALEANPGSFATNEAMAALLARQGFWEKAVEHYLRMLAVNPDDISTYGSLARIFSAHGDIARHFVEPLARSGLPVRHQIAALNDLAWIMATSPDPGARNGQKAALLAQAARALDTRSDPRLLDTQAAALAEQGHFDEAVDLAAQAVDLAQKRARQDLAAEIQARLELYQAATPYREDPSEDLMLGSFKI